jgi:drug/metabolite transporter (DMT)-like permease
LFFEGIRSDLLAIISGSVRYALPLMLPRMIVELVRVGATMPSLHGSLILLYLGVGVSGLVLLLYGYSLRALPARHVAVIGNLDIVAGIVVAVIVLHEIVTGNQVIGGVLVLGSVWLVTTASHDPLPASTDDAVRETGHGTAARRLVSAVSVDRRQ